MDQNEVPNDVPVMSAVDIAEGLPNAGEGFPSDAETGPSVAAAPGGDGSAHVQGIFVAGAQCGPHALVTTDQLGLGIKTTHIVIHDQTLASALAAGVKGVADQGQPQQPDQLSPTTVQPRLKYNWDDSVHESVLPIRCKSTNGELHKDKFGSGGRGRCIKVVDNWYTPSEFESICGRASSKDWKRSIRYGGRTLQCLIEEGLLLPHATSCTCAACCDDVTVLGPVRFFVPYQRRKREGEQSNQQPKKLQREDSLQETKDSVPATLISGNGIGTDMIQVVTSDGTFVGTTTVDSTSVMVAPMNSSSKMQSPITLDFNEQKHWWQLEEMVNNLVNYSHQVKQLMEQLKAQSLASREFAVQQLQQLHAQLNKEKAEALNSARIEAQITLQRAVMEERREKEIAVQQALQRSRSASKSDLQHHKMEDIQNNVANGTKCCANCNREAFSECTGCRSVSYCSPFCQQKDWVTHQHECGSDIGLDKHVDEHDKQ